MVVGKAVTLGSGVKAPVEKKAVNLMDYDGTVLYSYTAAEFAELTALPPNPSHTGLTAQGWNWSLSDAKTFVASFGRLDIGQMYATSDGKTRIYLHLDGSRLNPYLGLAINGTVAVDWGDGSTDTVTGSSLTTVVNTQHVYPAAGDYVIVFAVSGSMALTGASGVGSKLIWKAVFSPSNGYNQSRCYQSMITKAEIGGNCTLGEYAFSRCVNLESITLPSGMSSIPDSCFYGCGLRQVVVPAGVTNICASAFYSCKAKSISLPRSVTSIGSSAFYSACVEHLIIPDGVTQFPESIANNSLVQSVTVPPGLTAIGATAFYNCVFLARMVIPAGVGQILMRTFVQCYGLQEIVFRPISPPTVANNAAAWTHLPHDCTLYVPAGSLSAYTAAANYPDPTLYTYTEYAAGTV